MNFNHLLDATEPVTVEFLEKTITCNVFVAGPSRLTKQEQERLSASIEPLREAAARAKEIEMELALLNGDNPERKTELTSELQSIAKEMDEGGLAQTSVPLMVRDFEMDGETLTWKDQPISHQNIHELPVSFLIDVALAARDVWMNPTTGALSESGAPLEGKSDESQAETITPSANSD